MIKDKISSQEIIELIAIKASISKRAAEDFLKVLFLSIEEALLLGESVKIKQLGTFKLQWIEPRKSVNVRNGEDVVLAGYYKVNFAPESILKAIVNEPFAHLEAVELDGQLKEPSHSAEFAEVNIDPLRLFTEQASEISSLLSEIQALSNDKQTGLKMEELSDELSIVEVKVDETVSVLSVDSEHVIPQNVVVTEPKFIAPVFEDVSKSSETESEANFNLFMKEVKPLSKTRHWLFILPLLIIFSGIALWCFSPTTNEYVQTVIEKSDSFFRPPIIRKIVRKKLVIIHRRYIQKAISTNVMQKDSLQLLFDNERVYKKFIASERIAEGSRLARMSLRYYGCSDFWVYIYEANQSKIPNPDDIPFGTMIRIPKLDARLIDAKNPRCIKKARELHDWYVKR
jgi:nucleoid DNA-binding protein